jgi:AcrR family transcriptional regulator
MRRIPQQERAEKRMQDMLAAAGAVIAERGLAAATMTEIAARAGVSIGAVYQYFPNKDALAIALRTEYGSLMDERWSALAEHAHTASTPELAGRLIDLMTGFIGDHPAYLALSAASTPTNRSADDRSRLRQRFAELFVHRRSDLTAADALRIAEVLLQIVKGLPPLYMAMSMAAKPKERRLLIDEYKIAVTAYLTARLN